MSPEQYWMQLQKKNEVEVFNEPGITLAVMKREFGEKGDMVVTAFLGVIVAELVEAFNVGKTMDGMQVAFAVNGIKEDYWFVKIEQLKCCFDMAKKGKYGTMYDRIDAAVIFGWIDSFLDQQVSIAQEERNKVNKMQNQGAIHPDVLKKILPEKEKKFLEDQKDLTLKEPVIRERTEYEQLVQDILNEFDELHTQRTNKDTNTIRTIEYNSKVVTMQQFLELRLTENELL